LPQIVRNSPTALRILKAAMNAAEDGQAGIQELGGNATLLFYQVREGWGGGCSRSASGCARGMAAGRMLVVSTGLLASSAPPLVLPAPAADRRGQRGAAGVSGEAAAGLL
jgi:hypothetical protein